MIYLLLKIFNLFTRIYLSNLKYEIEKATLSNSGSIIKDLLDDMSLNYSLIIDKGEHHEDYVKNVFRDLLSGTNSAFNFFVEKTKDDWDTGREVPSG